MKRPLVSSLVFAGAFILGALLLAHARRSGWVDDDAPTRFIMVLSGVVMVWFSNFASKAAPSGHPGARLLLSWAMVLAGLFFIGVWLVAPVALALPLSVGVTLAALAFCIGFCALVSRRSTS